ncbi:MAG: DUF1501 domain-containing protein [Planctomycetes bacterium]|nr:DUF1501 domain-containing protein [Planctomycetota bacterium]
MVRKSSGVAGTGLTRRDWIQAGSLSVGGLSLGSRLGSSAGLAAEPVSGGQGAGAAFGRAKSVILFWLTGGPAQQESWDPKPNAPLEVRGPFQPIASRSPGLNVCELMPRTALLTDKIAVLRAMWTGDNAHSSSGYAMLTGMSHVPLNAESVTAKAPNLWPSADSIVRLLRPSVNGLPSSIVLPEHIWNDGNFPWPGQDAGFLGRKHDPWLVNCDPNEARFRIPDLAFPEDVSSSRFVERRRLLEQVNLRVEESMRAAPVRRYVEESEHALGLLGGSAARQAFDLSQEPDSVRERYGRSRYAQSVLLARRLVEAGTSIVRINWTRIKDKPNQGGWDTHASHSQACKEFLMPMMDQAYSALLEDLSQRGLLDQTLVVWLGEFGRTPKFNANGGRDHWGHVFSVALAGAGVQGGVVHGSSDRDAAYPVEGRVEPRDLMATLFHCLGYHPETVMHDIDGRPQPISRGEVVQAIF